MTSLVLNTIDYGDRGEVQIVADSASLAHEAADRLMSSIRTALDARGIAAVALSGGSTPKQMGRVLSESGIEDALDWSKVHFFWGDERWVPITDPESNAGEARRAFLDRLPRANVHAFATDGGTPQQSAADYEREICSCLPAEAGSPRFDLIFLGMGDDGHTASLFPDTAAIHETERLVLAHYVPKLNTTRLTMTPPLLNAARQVIFLAAGAGKAERLAEVLDGPVEVDRLPCQVIRPVAGGPVWLVDQAAAASLAMRGN